MNMEHKILANSSCFNMALSIWGVNIILFKKTDKSDQMKDYCCTESNLSA